MRLTLKTASLVGAALLLAPSFALAAQMTDEEIIKNAMSAAPAAVAENAAVVTFDDKMQMKTLKEGTNGFTCMADDPATPTNDPMCADENGMAWVHAWMMKEEPPAGKIGFGYMLMGGSAASNTDPYATEPPAGGPWFEDPPHVMIFNAKDALTGYPRPTARPTSTALRHVPDTPYEHLMVPIN